MGCLQRTRAEDQRLAPGTEEQVAIRMRAERVELQRQIKSRIEVFKQLHEMVVSRDLKKMMPDSIRLTEKMNTSK